jgi:hypothetical protein
MARPTALQPATYTHVNLVWPSQNGQFITGVHQKKVLATPDTSHRRGHTIRFPHRKRRLLGAIDKLGDGQPARCCVTRTGAADSPSTS